MPKTYDTFDRWKAAQVERVRTPADPVPDPVPPEALLPPGEEMAPEDPAVVVARYLALLNRCVTLAATQAVYDKELASLQARGDALRTAWATLHAEHTACVAALEALNLAPDALLRVLWQHRQTRERYNADPIPAPLREWLQGLGPPTAIDDPSRKESR